MKSRRSRHIQSKRMVSGFGSAVLVMGTLFILPQTASAEVRTIRMPEDMCNVLREEPLNLRILEQVRERPDFARVLEYVESTCGELGGLLIGPTGSIAGASGDGGTSPEGGNGFVFPDGGGEGLDDEEGEGGATEEELDDEGGDEGTPPFSAGEIEAALGAA
jgi:hypothetical protein